LSKHTKCLQNAVFQQELKSGISIALASEKATCHND